MTTPSPALTLRAVEFLAALATLVTSLELLHERHAFLPGHLFALPSPLADNRPVRGALRRAGPLLVSPGIIALLALRVLAAAATLFQTACSGSRLLPLLVLTVLAFVFHLRDSERSNGADRFLLLVLPVCTLAELFPGGNVPAIVLFFLAAQTSLVYASTGLLKLGHASWRDGSALLHVLSGSEEGNQRLYGFFRARPRLAVLGGYAVAAEALLALAPLLPPALCLVLLAGGVLLHLLIARTVGLNVFLFSFPAAYPAMLFVSCTLYGQAGVCFPHWLGG